MGGHAYSKYNNVHVISNDFAVFTTGGGDNTVLAQQGAQFLLSNLANARNGKYVVPTCDFLKKEKEILLESRLKQNADLLDVNVLRSALEWLSVKMLVEASSKLAKSNKRSTQWNNNMCFLIQVTRPFGYMYILDKFQKNTK